MPLSNASRSNSGSGTGSHTLDHCREGQPGKVVGEFGPATVDVDRARQHADRREAGLDRQRVKPAPDVRVAARRSAPPQFGRHGDHCTGGLAAGMEVGRAIFADDDRDRAAGPIWGFSNFSPSRGRAKCSNTKQTNR